jgi:N-acetyl-alpha-D-muramate 1-phosphate uridylyltransferase
MSAVPKTAMLLAAGLGTRMRPLTDVLPKPLVPIGGRTLADRALDRLEAAGVETVVVNVHHFAEKMQAHLAARTRPRIVISDERERLLESGGGIVKALPLLGAEPFFVVNADSIWIEGVRPNLRRLAAAFDPARMDGILLLALLVASTGYDASGDFALDPLGRLRRRREREITPFAYAGAAILKPELFSGLAADPFSLNRVFDRALESERLYGIRLEGFWMHVGTPTSIASAEAAIAESAA